MRDLICPPRLSLISCHGEKLKEPTIQANITIHFNQSIDFIIVHMHGSQSYVEYSASYHGNIDLDESNSSCS